MNKMGLILLNVIFSRCMLFLLLLFPLQLHYVVTAHELPYLGKKKRNRMIDRESHQPLGYGII